MVDDLGSDTSWVGVTARSGSLADSFRSSGYTALLRANGEVVLYSPKGLNATKKIPLNPKASEVTLCLRMADTRITVLVNGLTVVEVVDDGYDQGYAGVAMYSIAKVGDIRIRSQVKSESSVSRTPSSVAHLRRYSTSRASR